MIELTGHHGLVVALAYSPDGRTLASASADGTARLWDLNEGKLIAMLQSPAARAHCVAFSPDGKLLAVGYGGQRGLVQLWDLNPPRLREAWAAHEYNTRALTFGPESRHLITAGNQPAVRLWDIPALERMTVVTDSPAPAKAVLYHPDGSFFAVVRSHA